MGAETATLSLHLNSLFHITPTVENIHAKLFLPHIQRLAAAIARQAHPPLLLAAVWHARALIAEAHISTYLITLKRRLPERRDDIAFDAANTTMPNA